MASKSLNEIRSAFLNYFEKNDHKIVESSNLVPNNDPTLMFVNSGMVQFKNIFTGLEKIDYLRATTSQKCVRAGGKHNDLENVGYTPRHHTFFEMLGNFSFGDYFKEKAISLAWDLITKEFAIRKDRLYITVFKDDDDAFNLWKKVAGLSDDRVIRIATSDNFWSMGETGPCGPCSEIFVDHGDHLKGGLPGTKNQDGDRFIEIWNLVFMQFEQVTKDKRINLPKPSVDTGMGLERIAALLQGSHDNYVTDHFKKLIQATSDAVNKKPDDKNISSFRVIADHLRASSFLIAEGVLPSNEGRGYVLRRIMRRGMRHSHLLGAKEPIFFNIFKTLQEEMSNNYPELNRAQSLIKETLKMEEEKFLVLLERGIKILNDEISKIDKILPGEVAFKLYDTYGFPLDLTEDILRNKSLTVNQKKFYSLMKESRELAKKNWKGSGDSSVDEIWFEIKDKLEPTEFLGYEKDRAEGVVLSLLKDNKEVQSLNSGDEGMIITNQTPFYGESGGQIGDTGQIISGELIFEVKDVQKKLGNLFVHYGKVVSANISLNDNVEMKIDVERRNNTRACHSATHLLHESLRRVLGTHVIQKGSYVGPDKLRFDFSHIKAVTKDEISKIEQYVNSMIKSKGDVRTRLMTPKEAVDNGALALFGEKYSDEVRVLSMGDEKNNYFSTELCGGTHVKNTVEIGQFKIISESSIASGVRRIEALRGNELLQYEKEKEELFKGKEKVIQEEINKFFEELKAAGILVKDKKTLKDKKKRQEYFKLLDKKNIENGLKDKKLNFTLEKKIKNIDVKFHYMLLPYGGKKMRILMDHLKDKIQNEILVLFAWDSDMNKDDPKTTIAVNVNKNLTKQYDARKILKRVSTFLGTKEGGGREEFAMTSINKMIKEDELDRVFEDLIQSLS